MEKNLFGDLAKELAQITNKLFKDDKDALLIFKRLFKNITLLFENLDFNNIEFETFEGLFDNKKVNNVENDLTLLERYYDNKAFQELLISLYPIIRLYYAIRLYDQKMQLSKFYIKSGLQKQSEFERLKEEAEELSSKTELDLVINFVKQNKKLKRVWYKLIPHYSDIAQRFNYYKKSGSVNYTRVATYIRRTSGSGSLKAIEQALLRYRQDPH